MNKIEWLLSELEAQLEEYKDSDWMPKSLEPKIKFIKWLLEEKVGDIHCEFHTDRVKPNVWGVGDVSYNINIQVDGPQCFGRKTGFNAYDTATILVFKYPEVSRSKSVNKE